MLTIARAVRLATAVVWIGTIHYALLEAAPRVGFAGLLLFSCGNIVANLLSGGSPRERRLWALAVLAALAVALTGRADGSAALHALLATPFVANLVLLLLFALSLRPGRMPLVTRFSRLDGARIELRIDRYTRSVTILWAVFFAAVLSVSGAAVLAGYAAAASWAINVGAPAGSLALFLLEHLYRYARPEIFGRVSIVATLRAVARPEAWRATRHDA